MFDEVGMGGLIPKVPTVQILMLYTRISNRAKEQKYTKAPSQFDDLMLTFPFRASLYWNFTVLLVFLAK